MIMHMHMHGAVKVLEKHDRSRLDFDPLEASCDRLVHVILTEGTCHHIWPCLSIVRHAT